MTTAISVAGVSKRFRLYHEKYTSLKERLIHLGRIPFEDFWALRDIHLDIEEGATVGLLGHNGSGKSTLLKCVAGILRPTTGVIATRGRVAALLELGAGFQPELTGRENIFLNGALLGMSKRAIAQRFDDIVAFAELEQFIDTQVRFYSSGMYVRLGFAVAVNVDPAILLVDEVLAVGDESFQRKCLDRVRQLQREGRTILVVTHSPDLARQVCHAVAVLDHGRLVAHGDPATAVRSYRQHLLEHERHAEASVFVLDQEEEEEEEQQPLRITDVELVYPHRSERRYLLSGEPLEIRVGIEVGQPVDDVALTLLIHDGRGNLLHGVDTARLGVDLGAFHGRGQVVFSCDAVPLLDGDYPITIGVTSRDGARVYDWQEQRIRFEVMNPGNASGVVALPLNVTVSHEPLPHQPVPHQVGGR
jgi:ABC-2 type transport system ATP-binding protein